MARQSTPKASDPKHAREMLQQSGSNFDLPPNLLENLQAAYVVHDHNTNIVAWNAKALELLGLSADQMLGKSAMDPYWHFVDEAGEKIELNAYPVNLVLAQQQAIDNYIVGISSSKHNNIIWAQVSAAPILNKEGKISHVFITFMDVSERVETQKFLSSIIDGATDGLCVCHPIESFPYVEFTVWNDQMTKLTGYTMQQINEMGWYQSLYPDPELQSRAIERMQAMRVGDDIQHEEWEIVRADGEKRIFAISTRFLDTQSQPGSVLGLMQDVTEARRAEKKLRDSESLFRGLIQSSPIATLVVTADPIFHVLHMNKQFEELFGWTMEDIPDVEHWWPKAYPNPQYRKRIQAEWQARVDTATIEKKSHIAPMEARVTCKNQELKDIEFHMAIHGDKAIVIFNDLTAHRQAEESMRQSAAVIDNTSEGIMVLDTSLQIMSVNRAFSEITGYTENEVMLKPLSFLSSDRQGKEFYDTVRESIKKDSSWQGEVWSKRKNGEAYPEWLTISSIQDEQGNIKNYVGIFSDISLIKKSEQQLYFLAHHDQLTELPNRFHFNEQLEHTILRADRDQLKFALLFIDMDHFKHINDSFGHPTGDKVLLTVARRINAALRKKDTVARLGGDEFVVLIEDIVDLNSLARVAKKIIKTLSAPITVDKNVFYLSASVGIAIYPENGKDVTTLISNADAAMYRAKEEGRNNFQFYTRDMTETAMERVVMESDLRHAINNNELSVFLQPIYDSESGNISGAEILVRWQHKTHGFIPPDKFIPLAEESGLIDKIGQFVLTQACNIASRLYKGGNSHLKFSINLSARQLQKLGATHEILNIVDSYDFPLSMLELELTETVFAHPSTDLIDDLKLLRKRNISIAVDDFGTGFSSLVYLKRFPLDKLKIDRSFVGDIPDDENDMAITRAIIALGQSLQLTVVAEGVETEFQRQFLLEQGCDYLQGFLFNTPMPVNEFDKLINTPEPEPA